MVYASNASTEFIGNKGVDKVKGIHKEYLQTSDDRNCYSERSHYFPLA